MNNITTYSAHKRNVFMWLATVLMVASLVARIVWYAKAGVPSVLVAVVHIILPLAANLLIILRLPFRSEKFFYVTVRPVVLLGIHFIFQIFEYDFSQAAMTIACLLFCLIQTVLYYLTFTGKISSKIPVLLSYLAFILLVALDKTFAYYWGIYVNKALAFLISDATIVLGIVCLILAPKKLPAPKEGDEYRPRYGDRIDGRLVRNLPPMTKAIPYIMVNRNGASNLIRDSIEVSNMEKYIHKMRREGYKHFGITHVFLATYVRLCAEYPGLNRFLSGQKIFHRYTIDVNMVVKKEMTTDAPDTAIKVIFDPNDTAADVYTKFDAAVQSVKASSELDSNLDALINVFNLIPGLFLKFCVWLLKTMDYFGLLPKFLMDLSPFHGSMFVTSMGSLGIPPIFHHLYDFGNLSQFLAFGAKRTVKSYGPEGEEIVKRYVDFTYVTDERVCDGFYYAAALKRSKTILAHPELLDEPPVEVKEDVE